MLLLLKLLLQLFRLLLLLDEGLLILLELFPLFLSDFDGLGTYDHLFFHLLQPANELLLLCLRLLLGLLSLADFIEEAFLLLLLEVGLVLNAALLFLCLLLDLFFLLSEPLLELLHLLLVFHVHDLLHNIGVAHDTSLLHQLGGVHTLVEESQLLSELHDFILIFSQEGILRVFVNLGLVLDVFGPTSITKRVHGLIEVVVSGADVGDHKCLRVSSKRVLK
mmetsp:Transcript_34684/g.53167  ORF Transcript_34684/g.53167 Transcript_34684/m.53167 type:complete len:221 (+) Transcript_34684:775-1437(+)